MTEALLERLPTARLVELLDELLTTEARMAALGQLGADIRAELNRRGAEIYERDGMAPTWRADDKLGTISYSVGKDAVIVVDRDDWLSWAAQHYPDEVTATLELPAAALPFVLELLTWAISGKSGEQVPPCLAGWQPRPTLAAREAWQKGYLDKHTTVIEPDQICNEAGELIPGLAQRRVGRVGVSVRVNPEAKDRAIAELGDPMAFAVLTAPIGQVAAAHADAGEDEPHLVDAADGEPDYDDPPSSADPLVPNVAPARGRGPAIVFETLRAAMKCIRSGVALDPFARREVRDALTWLDDQADPVVDGEEARFAADYPGDWRTELLAAADPDAPLLSPPVGRLSPLLPLDTMTKPELQELARRRGLARGGTKADLVARIRQADGDLAGAR